MHRVQTRLLKKWATRCVLEASEWEQNWFITLTYDEEHKPTCDEMLDDKGRTYLNDGSWNGYLKPRDMTLFLKKLRKYYKTHFDHDNIRYFYCGEYGTKNGRPHYHVIFFNLPIPTGLMRLDSERAKSSGLQYKVDFIENIWGMGRVRVSEVNWATCAYTARYITKKVNGEMASEHYASLGQTPEFVRMSRMPGIARNYYEQHKDEIYDLDEIIMKLTGERTLSIKPPSYYDKLYDIEYPEDMQRIKEVRRNNALEAQKIKQSKTSLSMLKQLNIEEDIQKEKAKRLIREI